jgi:hypothetical protein
MQSKARNAIILAVLILTAFLIVSYARWPIETPLSNIISPRETYYAQTQKLVYEVADDLVNIRELTGPDEIKIQIVDVEWTKENWGRKTSQTEINQLKTEEQIYKHLFIVPQDFDLLAQKEQEAGSILAALWGDALYFVSDYFDPYNEAKAKETIAHELAHLLQSINFKLEQPTNLDASLARGALVEGEAEVTKNQYLELILNKNVNKDSFPVGDRSISVDEFFWLKWTSPGIFGIEFIEKLYNDGGWARVDQAFNDIPKTMEQIMHPEKYSTKEEHQDLEAEKIEDWDLKTSDRMGELFILLFLARHIPIDDATVAAAGWSTDNFAYYQKQNEYFYEWKTQWDTPTDANQFTNALESLFRSIQAQEIAPQSWKINGEYLKINYNNYNVTIFGSSNYEIIENQ